MQEILFKRLALVSHPWGRVLQVEQVVQAAGLLGKLLGSSVNSATLIALWGAADYSSTVVPRLLQAIRLAGPHSGRIHTL